MKKLTKEQQKAFHKAMSDANEAIVKRFKIDKNKKSSVKKSSVKKS